MPSCSAEPATQEAPVFARVGEAVISVETFREELFNNSRNMFYHGTPPQEEVFAFERETADRLITTELLSQEARRRNLQVDQAELDSRLARYLDRESRRRGIVIGEDTELWQKLSRQAEVEILIEQLQTTVKLDTPTSTESDLQEFYQKYPEKFTEPERTRLSGILLKVDPSSPSATWQETREKAQDLVHQLRSGEDFAAMARMHSEDISASNGGDMGYLHEGMLNEDIQKQVDALQPGEISEPMRVLEGILIVRLDEQVKSRLLPFSQVRDRVNDLCSQEAREQTWQAFLFRLRESTVISIDERYFSSPK